MRLGLALAAALFGGACSVQITDGSGSRLAGVDGGVDPTSDATITPRCASRTVYLNFDGQTLQKGPSDATLNQASWMQIATGTAPRYLSSNTNRMAVIQNVVAGVQSQLSSFPVTVVTTRPPSGSYVMIVFGGTQQQVGSLYGGAVNQLDCGDQRPNDVAWIGDGVTPVQRVVNFTVGAIGFGLGLTATQDPNDCMCGWDNVCTSNNTAACNLTSPINRDLTANQTCAGLSVQDEVATFRKAFCE